MKDCRSRDNELLDLAIVPTVFPDGTVQVWKLPEEYLGRYTYSINWEFESLQEFFAISQLVELLRHYSPDPRITLSIPFLPFGRQDKPVGNDATFGLFPFSKMLEAINVDEIVTVDVHGSKPRFITNRGGYLFILNAVDAVNPSVICYPDKGASERYDSAVFAIHKCPCTDFIRLGKKRDPLTGSILGLKVESTVNVSEGDCRRILIVDDICDGGRTFIEAAKLLHDHFPGSEVHLYVTHGIFSQGTQVLYDAGIKSIHTRKGLVS